MKPKKCKECGDKFCPQRPLQFLCGPKCAIEYGKKQKAKSWAKEKKQIKEKLMTRTEWLKCLQIVFNSYIRNRDEKRACISCGAVCGGLNSGTAGHFYSVGSYPNLRFNEDNVHLQCTYCNMHLHSNPHEYEIGLIKRIGKIRFNSLLVLRNKELKLSLDQIKDLIKEYKQKIKNP